MFFRTIWETGEQMSWEQWLAESLIYVNITSFYIKWTSDCHKFDLDQYGQTDHGYMYPGKHLAILIGEKHFFATILHGDLFIPVRIKLSILFSLRTLSDIADNYRSQRHWILKKMSFFYSVD